MAPSNLQGLNVVQATPAAGREYTSDSQDLLDFPTYRDFNAQLDLWTNLTFESDEPFLRKGQTRRSEVVRPPASDDSADDDDETAAKENDMLYPGDAHENIVTGIPLPDQSARASRSNAAPARAAPAIPPAVDLASFLTSFGIDPFGLQAQQLQQSAFNIPSLAQLFPSSGAAGPQSGLAPPVAASSKFETLKTSPAPKRARTTKSSSVSTGDMSPAPEVESPTHPNGTPVTPAEDKRRRNTAASARFRLKKKEREAALEKKAKELEAKVNELEKECEGLRRENGWLKGLVVGVTGGVAQQQTQVVEVRAGAKRGRDGDDGDDDDDDEDD